MPDEIFQSETLFEIYHGQSQHFNSLEDTRHQMYYKQSNTNGGNTVILHHRVNISQRNG